MSAKITMQELRDAKQSGHWRLERASMFYLRRYGDELRKPTVVIKEGTTVDVEKLYRRGRCALLKYTDHTGKVWWSWTHASEYEEPRKYTKRKTKDL